MNKLDWGVKNPSFFDKGSKFVIKLKDSKGKYTNSFFFTLDNNESFETVYDRSFRYFCSILKDDDNPVISTDCEVYFEDSVVEAYVPLFTLYDEDSVLKEEQQVDTPARVEVSNILSDYFGYDFVLSEFTESLGEIWYKSPLQYAVGSKRGISVWFKESELEFLV